MKGDTKVIEYLNKGLRSELTAVSQYWVHFRLLEDWGFSKLAKKERAESIEEMHHADRFIDRIVFLEKGKLLVDLPTEQFFAPHGGLAQPRVAQFLSKMRKD